jgi:uncharacterized membrane protein
MEADMTWIKYLPEQIESFQRPRTRSDDAMQVVLSTAAGLALGAGVMYLLDPVGGARRRNYIRGKMSRAVHQTGTSLRKTGEYGAGQARGFFARMRARFGSDQVSDPQLCQRVRSALGRAISHPRAIEVQANDGVVTLCGDVLANELDQLVKSVEGVRGVERVDCALDVHKNSAEVPSLQGESRRPAQRFPFMRDNWSPTTRTLANVTGASMIACAVSRPRPMSLVWGVAGLGLIARAASNLPMRRLFGIGAGRRAIDVQKTININAPLDMVFGFFADYRNFPYFMSNIVQVSGAGYGWSHWVVKGPAGIKVEWDAELTRFVPNLAIGWKSLPGSTVANAGIISFDTNYDGSTRVDIKLSYNPPGGALGHLVARIFGADARSEMDQDLLRAKTLLETGQPAHDTAAARE